MWQGWASCISTSQHLINSKPHLFCNQPLRCFADGLEKEGFVPRHFLKLGKKAGWEQSIPILNLHSSKCAEQFSGTAADVLQHQCSEMRPMATWGFVEWFCLINPNISRWQESHLRTLKFQKRFCMVLQGFASNRSKYQKLILSGLCIDYKSLRTTYAWSPHWHLWREGTPPWWRESCIQSTLRATAQMTGAFREELSTGDPWEQWWAMEYGWKWRKRVDQCWSWIM